MSGRMGQPVSWSSGMSRGETEGLAGSGHLLRLKQRCMLKTTATKPQGGLAEGIEDADRRKRPLQAGMLITSLAASVKACHQ